MGKRITRRTSITEIMTNFFAKCTKISLVRPGPLTHISCVLVATGGNSQHLLPKLPRLRKVSAEFGRKIREEVKYTRRARLREHARRVFITLTYLLPSKSLLVF